MEAVEYRAVITFLYLKVRTPIETFNELKETYGEDAPAYDVVKYIKNSRGSIGNMYGMVMARYKIYPDVKTEGTWGKKPLVAFASQDAHYSVLKAAHWMGLGTNNVIYVKTDERGSMIPEELEKEVERVKQEGRLPFFVNATSGTTVLGAYDPIAAIADVCEKHGMWLHVDGAWGGSAMLSAKYKYLMDGLHRADSYVWNPHKMLGVPLQCTVFVTKHKGMLHHCNSASATYLFQQDKFYDVSYDTGDKSVQCGRKVDAFKLWVMWKVRGDKALESRVDNAFDQSRNLRDLASSTPGFRMVLKDIAAPNVCFWYIPKRLRDQPETEEWWQEVSKVAPAVKEKMTMSGSMMVGYQPLPNKGLKNFFRFVISSMPERTKEDMEFIIAEIQRLGEEC